MESAPNAPAPTINTDESEPNGSQPEQPLNTTSADPSPHPNAIQSVKSNESSVSVSKKFLSLCKQCKDEDHSSEDIIASMRSFIEEHSTDSIDINYLSDTNDFPMRYIIKYCRPKILQFILDTFNGDDPDRRNYLINLHVIYNPVVNHNILHLMINELGGGKQYRKTALGLIGILFDEQNVDRLQPGGLLYTVNDYGDTPISFARKRKFGDIAKKLEELKYIHIHDLLCMECNVTYDVAHCIVEHLFVVVHWDELDKMRHRWTDVLVNPGKSQ